MKAAKQKRSKKAAAVVPSRAGSSNWWLYFAGAILTLAAVFAVYGPALHGPFVLDDIYLPYLTPNFSPNLRAWISGMRPVLMFSFWLNYSSSGTDTYSYHALNVLLHFVNGVIVFLIVRRLLQRVKVEGFLLGVLSTFAAGVFLLHPLQTESVAYVASRSEVLSVLFFNAAFAAFLYRRKPAISAAATTAVLVLFGCAVLSKEHTAILPVLLLLTDYFWNPGFSFEGIRRNWKLYLPILFGGALGGIYVLRIIRNSPTAGFSIKQFTWYQYFFTQCRVIWHYLLLFLFPFGQNLDPDIAISRTVFDHFAIVGLIALLASTAAAWIYRRRYPLASYGWFVWMLLLAPTSSFVPIQDVMAERRVYLPFIGLLFLMLEFLRRWKAGRGVLIAALGGILCVEAALTYQRSEVWGSSIALWRDTVSKSPHKLRPNFQLAKAYYDEGQCAASLNWYEKTAQIQPPDFTLLVDWALALNCSQKPDEAIAMLRLAAAQHPTAHIYSQIAAVYGNQGKFPEALEALDQAVKLNASYDMIYFYRGTIFYKRGELQRAEAEYRHAIQLNPNNSATGDALRVVERALQNRP